eukprot:3206265-Rhodomonas_salina.1
MLGHGGGCRRAVQYESCGGGKATDIICPMYPTPAQLAARTSLQEQVGALRPFVSPSTLATSSPLHLHALLASNVVGVDWDDALVSQCHRACCISDSPLLRTAVARLGAEQTERCVLAAVACEQRL